MEKEVVIICPKCNAHINLKFDRAIPKKLKCPKCPYEGKFEESIGTEGPNFPSADKLYKPGKLIMIESDAQWLQAEKIVDLKRGVNTLGRLSPNSTSNTQLPTNDTYMSRDHAAIDVIMKAGGIFEHSLSDMGSSNGTFHNGDRLEKGDVIKLQPGETIRLGHTTFKFITG